MCNANRSLWYFFNHIQFQFTTLLSTTEPVMWTSSFRPSSFGVHWKKGTFKIKYTVWNAISIQCGCLFCECQCYACKCSQVYFVCFLVRMFCLTNVCTQFVASIDNLKYVWIFKCIEKCVDMNFSGHQWLRSSYITAKLFQIHNISESQLRLLFTFNLMYLQSTQKTTSLFNGTYTSVLIALSVSIVFKTWNMMAYKIQKKLFCVCMHS